MEQITLRLPSLSDLDIVAEMVPNPDVALFLPGMIADRDGLEKWIRNLSDHEHEFMVLMGEMIIGGVQFIGNG